MIKFDEWKKIELKTAKILSVEDIAGKDNLYKVQIDLGSEKRTLVAGLKQHYSKEELQGKSVIVFCNLEPKNLAGIESNGMLLATRDTEGKYRLLGAEGNIAPGTPIE